VTGKARKHFLWTGVVLALLGLVPGTSRPAHGGLAALDSFHIGRYHLANGERTKALDAFNDALRLNPQFVQAYVARGKLYAEMGQYESALVDLDFALRLQPTHAEAFAYRGFANLSLGKFQEAMPDLDTALRIDPTYARVHFLRGQALKMLGDERGSTTSMALAKRLDPTLEISQVVTASANGSINDHVMQINGASASPQRTPITTDLMPSERRAPTAADRRMQGRLVPFEKHPILADVAPPSASRLPDGTDLPPGFSMNDRALAPGGGMSSGILRNRRTTTTVIEDRAIPSSGKIPDLTSPPLRESAGEQRKPSPAKGPVLPSVGSVEALPAQEMTTMPRAAIAAGGTTPPPVEPAPAVETTTQANDLLDDFADLVPLPSTAELLQVAPDKIAGVPIQAPAEIIPLPPVLQPEAPLANTPPEAPKVPEPAVTPVGPTTAPAASTAAAAPPAAAPNHEVKGVLGDMGVPSAVLITEPTTAATKPAAAAEPAIELTASEILKRRQTQGFVLPAKTSDAENERRLAAAVDAARSALTPGVSTIVGDDMPPPVAEAPAATTPSVAPEAAAIADAEYRRGLKLEAEGDIGAAIAAYRQAIAINPTDPQVFCRRGHLLIESERSAEALADFNEAVKLAPGLSNGYYGRAHVRYVTQQYADACDDFTVAIRLDDQHAQAYIERGHCLALLGKLPEAKADREAALAIDPSLAKNGPRYAIGNSPSLLQVSPPVLTGATAFAGDDSRAQTNLDAMPTATDAAVSAPTAPTAPAASATTEAPAVPRVGSAFDGLFTQTPETLPPPSNLSKLSAENAAIASDDKATAIVSDDGGERTPAVTPAGTTEPVIAPTLPVAVPSVAPVIMPPMDMTDAAIVSDDAGDTGDTSSAAPRKFAPPPRDRAALETDLKRLTEQLSVNPGDAAGYFERAKTFLELNDAVAALEDLNVALRLSPTHGEALRLRATLSTQSGKYAEALVDLNEALRHNPADVEALSQRGYVRLASGQTSEAVTDFSEVLKAEPKDVATLCRRGMAYALLKDRQSSLADLDAAVTFAPQDAEVVLCRAKAQAEFGNKREAVADLNAAIKLNPQSAEAYFERSRLYAERGAYENAQADRRRALELDPSIFR